MAPRPVTIRLLDPPIHEFLPSERQLQSDIEQLRHLRDSVQGMEVLSNSLMLLGPAMSRRAIDQQIVSPDMVEAAITKKEQMLRKVRALTEVNRCLGTVVYGWVSPSRDLPADQAILEAEAERLAKGLEVRPQMMVPQVCTAEELRWIKKYVDEIRRCRGQERSDAELPLRDHDRGGTCLYARGVPGRGGRLLLVRYQRPDPGDVLLSREDAENKFLPMYNQRGILHDNPFEVLDTKGVGKLMEIAVQWGRQGAGPVGRHLR